MGMTVSIYRSNYDCTLNVFHGKEQVTVVNVEGPFEPTEDRPAAMLVAGPSAGGPNPIVVPAEKTPKGWLVTDFDGSGPRMFGGTYAATSDSRWSRAVEALGGATGAVSVHDRVESWAQYNAMVD